MLTMDDKNQKYRNNMPPKLAMIPNIDPQKT